MALAWVSWSPERSGFEVETGSNRYFDVYLATRPELMRPQLAASRTQENFFSSRTQGTRLPAPNGRALFALPAALRERFGAGNVYVMVKSFGDARGAAPARSPVLDGAGRVVLTDVDPDGPGGDAMPNARPEIDLEELAARLPRNGHGGNRGVRARATSAGRAAPARPAGNDRRSGAGRRDVARVLALSAQALQSTAAADPTVPGTPSLRSAVDIMATSLAFAPGRGDASAAAVLNGLIAGRPPFGGRAELSRQIMRAAPPARVHAQSRPGYAREQFAFLAALAPLLPHLLTAIPAILPVIMPLIQQLLGGLSKSKSASRAHEATGVDPAVMQQIMAAVAQAAPAAGQAVAAAAPAVGSAVAAIAAPAAAVAPAAAPAAPPTAAPAAPPAAPAAPLAPAAPADPATAAAPAPAMSPDQAAALAGLLGAAGGTAGGGGGGGVDLGGLAGMATGGVASGALPLAMEGVDKTHELVKSVVDRLPIEKMMDGKAWVPTSNYDEWRSSMPWDQILSVADPAAVAGVLFVPGRRKLSPLPGVKLALVERTTTRLPGAGETWTFLADRTAVLRLEVVAGPDGLQRPFVDVRVSRDGTPAGGIWRSAFRLRSLAPRERRVATIELSPDVLAGAAQDGTPTCVSLRVVEQRGEEFRAAEHRAQLHVVAPATLVVDGRATLDPAPELAGLAGLERQVSAAALAPDLRMAEWAVELGGGGNASALAHHAEVTDVERGGERMLRSALTISPLGVADLARRRDDNALGADEVVALAAALEAGAGLRRRMSLTLREELEPALLTSATGGIGVRVELGWLNAHLVTFGGASPDGNPSRRDVRPVAIPVPQGLSIRAL